MLILENAGSVLQMHTDLHKCVGSDFCVHFCASKILINIYSSQFQVVDCTN